MTPARQYAPTTGRLDPLSCLYQESDEQGPQYIDPRLLERTNGHDPSDMSYSDGQCIDQLCNGVERTQLAQPAAIDTAQTQPEDANHDMDNHAESGADSLAETGADNNGDSDADNLLAEVAKTPDIDGRSQQTTSEMTMCLSNHELTDKFSLLDKVIIETKDKECLIVRKETLKTCSSRFLRRSVENMKPNDIIVYMTRDNLGSVKFYFSWLEGGSAARNDNFLRPKSDGSPGFTAQFETLFDFYMTGFRLVDVEFMDWVVDKWIDLLDQGYYPSDMAKRIYDARPLDLPLKRLYVATWAILSDEKWLTDTVDGQNAPTEFFDDVCKTKKKFTERLKHILKPGQLWMPWRARWAYYSDPRSKMRAVGRSMEATGNTAPGVPGATHSGQISGKMNNVTMQSTSNNASGVPGATHSSKIPGNMNNATMQSTSNNASGVPGATHSSKIPGNMNNATMQGTSNYTSAGPGPTRNGQTQEPTNNVTRKDTSNDPPGDANNRKRTAADEEDEDRECAKVIAKWKAQYAKRWTSPELQKKYGF
ncbi:hypothetical protein BKA80DRAFT_317529 [Phyllosticta citrichinensis]